MLKGTTQGSFDSNFISFHQVVVKKKIAKDFQSETMNDKVTRHTGEVE
jgi:hypothetical protein